MTDRQTEMTKTQTDTTENNTVLAERLVNISVGVSMARHLGTSPTISVTPATDVASRLRLHSADRHHYVPAHRTSLSTQHIRPLGFYDCWSYGLELVISDELRRIVLLGGELLAERCRTDDLLPSIPISCLPPCRVDSIVLRLNRTSSSIILSQVVPGRSTGLLQSVGGLSAAVGGLPLGPSEPSVQRTLDGSVLYLTVKSRLSESSYLLKRSEIREALKLMEPAKHGLVDCETVVVLAGGNLF